MNTLKALRVRRWSGSLVDLAGLRGNQWYKTCHYIIVHQTKSIFSLEHAWACHETCYHEDNNIVSGSENSLLIMRVIYCNSLPRFHLWLSVGVKASAYISAIKTSFNGPYSSLDVKHSVVCLQLYFNSLSWSPERDVKQLLTLFVTFDFWRMPPIIINALNSPDGTGDAFEAKLESYQCHHVKILHYK